MHMCKYACRCVQIMTFKVGEKFTGTWFNFCGCSWPVWTLSLSKTKGEFYHKRLNWLLIVQNSSMTIKQPVFFISKYSLDSFIFAMAFLYSVGG